jgi:gas vesicle protein
MMGYARSLLTASNKIADLSKEEKTAISQDLVKEFKNKFPQFQNILTTLPSSSKEDIKESIDKNIEKTYAPVYNQIDNFSEFHYSVTGEYEEIFTVLFGEIDNILKEQIFEPSNFSDNLNNGLKNINDDTKSVLNEYYDDIKSTVENEMDISEEETDFLLKDILKFTQEDMQQRFQNGLTLTFRGFGLAGGAAAGVMTKAISAKVATALTKKIATKVAIKTGAKVTGASSGLLCGPAAWLCSPAGAVVGGIVGWFATDKIVVELDQYYNEDEFKQELRDMIDQEKENTKQTMYKIYLESLDKLATENTNKLKNTKVIDLIK